MADLELIRLNRTSTRRCSRHEDVLAVAGVGITVSGITRAWTFHCVPCITSYDLEAVLEHLNERPARRLEVVPA